MFPKKHGEKTLRTPLQLTLISLCVTACVQNQQVIEKPAPLATPEADTNEAAFYIKSYKQDPQDTRIQIGRYATASIASTHEQEDLLDVVIQTTIPNDVKTIGEAINFLLMRSGYELAASYRQGNYVAQLLAKPLPYAHRKLGPIRLKDALLLLVGKAYWMKADPVHRLLAFETVKEFK